VRPVTSATVTSAWTATFRLPQRKERSRCAAKPARSAAWPSPRYSRLAGTKDFSAHGPRVTFRIRVHRRDRFHVIFDKHPAAIFGVHPSKSGENLMRRAGEPRLMVEFRLLRRRELHHVHHPVRLHNQQRPGPVTYW